MSKLIQELVPSAPCLWDDRDAHTSRVNATIESDGDLLEDDTDVEQEGQEKWPTAL